MLKNSKTVIFTSLITALLVSGFCGFLSYETIKNSQTKTEILSRYEIITKNNTIRAGYAVGAPLLMIDPNTEQKSGIFYDIVISASSKLGLEVEWVEEVGYGEMIQGLNNNRYDIIGSGVWINSARGKSASFTKPVYYDAVLAYVRSSDKRFNYNINILNSENYTISTMDGELGLAIANSDFPLAKQLQLPQNTDFVQLILNVLNKKADVVFLALGPARSYEQINPGKIKAIEGIEPLRVFPVAIMLPKGENELQESLNYALIEMQTTGEIEKIIQKYEPIENSFIRTALPYDYTEYQK